MLDEMETEDLRDLYVILNMLHWDAIDKIVQK
jgi:hypothetical protein